MLLDLVGHISGSLPILLLFTTVVALLSLKWARPSRRRLPPGPRALPLIGNMLQMPIVKPWETYNEWSKKYGALLTWPPPCLVNLRAVL